VRVFFTNLGCKLNQAENDRLARDFLAAGHQLAAGLGEADLHVVNSCTVTAAAARSSRQAARAASRASAGQRPRTVLTGCYATASPAEAASLAGVDLVVPNAGKEHLLERVREAFPEPGRQAPAAAHPLAPAQARLPDGHTRALVKIEDGCDMRCSFCIIPATRGRQRSRPAAEVVDEVRGLALAGYREIVITGVQISAYRATGGRSGRAAAAVGVAAPGEATAAAAAAKAGAGPGEAPWRRRGLAGLVRELLAALPAAAGSSQGPLPAAAPGPAARLRLTSIAPWELDDELLALWDDRRLCRHLHLSLQSGATATLRRMRRPYTAERYRQLIERVRAAVPGVAVTTDVIVGFPGETAADFEESLAAVAALGFAKVHVFPFSPRPGTSAAALPGAVPPSELRERMASMLAVAARSQLDFHSAHVGRREAVLWERPQGATGQGLTDNYIRVFSPEGAGLWNRFSEVELLALAPGGMLGRVVHNEID